MGPDFFRILISMNLFFSLTQIISPGKTIKRKSMYVLNPGDKLNVGILRVGAKFPFQLLFHIRQSV